MVPTLALCKRTNTKVGEKVAMVMRLEGAVFRVAHNTLTSSTIHNTQKLLHLVDHFGNTAMDYAKHLGTSGPWGERRRELVAELKT